MKNKSASSLFPRKYVALGSCLSFSNFNKVEIYASRKDHSQILFYFFPWWVDWNPMQK